jgi:peptidoglycan/xylan/chitin deacetylase (PgdA/CDA1 family)
MMSVLSKRTYILAAIVLILFGAFLGWKQYHTQATQHTTTIGVPILAYHKVNPNPGKNDMGLSITPADFDWEMNYLKDDGFHPVDLGAVIDHFQKGKQLPAKPIVITFDDGYQDNYRYAYPILKKYGLTATIFVITNTVGGINEFDFKKHIQPQNKMLTWSQIKEMNANGITIGAHTLDHVHLTRINKTEARQQIFESKKILEKELGKDVKYFSYPYGEYNEAVAQIVKDSGYLAATTTQMGLVQSSMNPYMLKRIGFPGHSDHQIFIKQLQKYLQSGN